MFKDNSIILFQGDSITDGARSRKEDLNHVLGHGYAYLLSARLGADYPGADYKFYNRGISGNRVSDLYGRWLEDAIKLNPDVLSILVGINDCGSIIHGNSGSDPQRFEKIYRLMLEEIRNHNPEVLLVLCEPFTLSIPAREEFNAVYRKSIVEYGNVTRKLAGEFQAVFVPLQKIFDDACSQADAIYWLWDGVHPTAAGHELIARAWLDAVKRFIG